jgi:mono/diheme cytochrome c family protein
MKFRTLNSVALAALAMLMAMAVASAWAKTPKKSAPAPAAAASAAAPGDAAQDDTMRLEGEKRFRANCARCHAAPPKFPPRMMGTIVRHMRVRAMITDEEMRLILHYMTE